MPPEDENDYLERFGLFFEMAGGNRTAGRLFGWLLISDPPHQSITELAAALGVSKASVSTVVRQMQQAGFVERVPATSAPAGRNPHAAAGPTAAGAGAGSARHSTARPGEGEG